MDAEEFLATAKIGDKVEIDYHSSGIGLGGGDFDHKVSGEVREISDRHVVVRDERGVNNHVPECWLDDGRIQ